MRIVSLTLLLPVFGLLWVANGDVPFSFREVTAEVGISPKQNDKVAGPSIADFNQDGYMDIIQTNHARSPADAYYGNAGGTFTKQQRFIAQGDRHGTCVGDLDNNGFPDAMIVTGAARNLANLPHVRIELTNPDGSFNTTTTNQTGFVQRSGYEFACRLMDMDRNGVLDMLGQGGLNPRKNNFIFKNQGGAFFNLLSSTIGSETWNPFAYGYLVTDFDMDGYLDIMLYGDHLEMWKGGRNFRFVNVTDLVFPSSYPNKAFNTAAQIDIDNDGDFDIYVTGGQRLKGGGVPGKDLLLENRNGTFVDISLSAGIPRRGGRIGVGVADFDNDGYMDLFLGSAISQPPNPNGTRMVDVILRNNGNNTFTSYVNHGATEADLTTDMTFPAGLQPFDYNRDGLVDVVVSTRLNYNKFNGTNDTVFGPLFGKIQLFKNIVSNTNNWITVKVPVNVQGRTTMDALLTLKTPGGWFYRRVGPVGEGRTQSFIDQVHFGLGSNTEVSEVVLELIGGFVTVTNNLTNIPVNQMYTLIV
mmetsp:Transcript_16121/g.32606  ORF Transcript_16121/g.32606 Transcript_16121/m.32606 type:complete len:527 (-) Transcript_16121:605-2185(-)|eukprot:CAMPEP_0184683808 /NCGR_PEP_ID=MMETSP0312-20130426/12668_1 /TAXON_ID=31354 /ORGANISM="Compsopogon coeruleus, Strain SAG 36.94" /LENGTH=526 /DNA_ID=CAMNT_0027136435 /DNA_START=195 /DNA_END=1775 /DNA_ORIENTATION=+